MDWPYVGWLPDILGKAELGGPHSLPIFFADYPIDMMPNPPPSPGRSKILWTGDVAADRSGAFKALVTKRHRTVSIGRD